MFNGYIEPILPRLHSPLKRAARLLSSQATPHYSHDRQASTCFFSRFRFSELTYANDARMPNQQLLPGACKLVRPSLSLAFKIKRVCLTKDFEQRFAAGCLVENVHGFRFHSA